MVRIGSWGLPEFGITEAIGGLFNAPRTAQGGSNLWGGQTPAQTTAPQVLGTQTSNQGFIGPQYPIGPQKPAGYQAPAQAGPGGANPIAGGNQSQPSQEELARQAAQQAYNAENQNLNTQYDYASAQLQNQLGTLGSQRDQSIAQVDLGLGDINRQVGTSKTNLQTNTQQQINEAGSTARNVQGQNRNVLRALGILNSSAAGQILAKPMNQFDQQRAQLGQFLVQKSAELDDFVNSKVTEASQVKNQIVTQYNDLVNKIQTDLRFNDRQRNDAIKSANAALSQRLSEISQSIMNYQQQVEMQKQQFAQSLATAMNYQAPTANLGDINATGVNTPGQQTQTANIYENPLKKKTLGGV